MSCPHARLRSVALVSVTALVVVACSSGDTNSNLWNNEAFEVSNAEIVDLESESGSLRTAISPSGKLAAVIGIDEVCVVPLDDSDDTGCIDADIDNRPEFESINWSSDESRLVFVGPSTQTGRDPDISMIELSDGAEFEVLTDDGADALGDDGDLDFAPFFGPDDTVYFFRLDRDDREYILHRIDDDGDAVRLDDIRLPDGVIPEPITRQLTETTAAIFWVGGDDGNGLSLIDLDDNSVEHIEVDPEVFQSFGATERYVVVGDISSRRIEPEPFELIDLETGRSRQIRADLDIDELMNAVGLTPSGDAIVANVRESNGNNVLMVLPIDDGRIGDPIDIVDVDDLDDFDDFDDFDDLRDLFVSGLGSRRAELVATASGQLFFAADDDIVLLTITGG